ncbi:hypothetical protein PHLCEN_2v3450, partial [Hermanssonia centrifuga]
SLPCQRYSLWSSGFGSLHMSSQLEKHIHVTEKRNASSDAWHNMTFSYIRLSRLHLFPLGTIFVFWPFAVTTFTFGAIATLLHSAACVLSDICDKDLDSQVGGYTMIFFSHYTVHILTHLRAYKQPPVGNRRSFHYWCMDIHDLHNGYATRRFTMYRPPSVLKYSWVASWSIFYDTIYAWQDRVDDAKAGVKSTALLFGNYVRPILSVFATTFVSLMWLAGILNGNGVWYFCISCGGAACHLIWQLTTWNDADNTDCAAKFAVSTVWLQLKF